MAEQMPYGDESTKETSEKLQADEKDDKFRANLKQLNGAVAPTGGKREKSIIKVQKFVNRLKRFVDTDKDSILTELSKLDVSMHLSEVCDALCESSLRLKDIPAMVEICSLLYRQYSTELPKPLCGSILRTFRACADSLTTLGTKRRSLARLMIELVLVGVCSESEGLPGVVNDLCDSTASEELLQHNIGAIDMLCRKLDASILGESGAKQEAVDAGLGKSLTSRQCCLTRKAQQALRAKLVEFYRSNAQNVFSKSDATVKERSSSNQQRRINKGSVDAESEAKYQAALLAFNRLKTHLLSLADLLCQPVPTLDAPEEAETVTRIQNETNTTEVGQVSGAEGVVLTMWEDDAERDFYENLLNLSDAVPGSLLGLKEKGSGVAGEPTVETREPLAEQIENSLSPTALVEQDKADTAEKRNVLLDQFLAKLTQASTGAEVDQIAMTFCYDQFNISKANRKKVIRFLLSSRRGDLYLLPTFARFIATVGPYYADIPNSVVESVMSELKDLMAEKDPLKIESKIKVIRYLGELCKFRLVPPGVIMDTLNLLTEDFSHHHAEMACQLIQSCGRFLMCFPGTSTRFENILDKLMRMKNIRNLPVHLEIMVEDTYFQLHPSGRKSVGAKELPIIRQFINHAIFVELHRRSDDSVLRSIRRLDWGNPDIPRWLQKAILDVGEHVAFHNIGNVASLLCALVPGRPQFVLQCIDALLESIQVGLEKNDFRDSPARIRQIKFVGELFNYRLFDTAMIFDSLFHLIAFSGPSSFGSSDIQTPHRLALLTGNTHLLPVDAGGTATGVVGTSGSSTRGLGTSSDVESFSVGTSQNVSPDMTKSVNETSNTTDTPNVNVPNPAIVPTPAPQVVYPLVEPTSPDDPPGDYFRIRLVCVILDTCGQYFSRGTAGEKMDRFLKFFQRYILTKAPLPMSIQYVVLDTLEKLRPKMKLTSSIQEADAAIAALLAADLAKGLNAVEADTCADDEVSESEDEEEEMESGSDSEGDSQEESSDMSDVSGDEDDESGDEDEDNDSDDEDRSTDDEEEHNRISFKDELFDLQLSDLLNESLHQAKIRARITTTPDKLEDLRLPIKMDNSIPTDAYIPEDKLRVRLVTRKGHKGIQLKPFDIPKDSRMSHAVSHKETEDAEEHARMKQFVLESVTRNHKQDIVDQQNEIRQDLFVPVSRCLGRGNGTRPFRRGRGGFGRGASTPGRGRSAIVRNINPTDNNHNP